MRAHRAVQRRREGALAPAPSIGWSTGPIGLLHHPPSQYLCDDYSLGMNNILLFGSIAASGLQLFYTGDIHSCPLSQTHEDHDTHDASPTASMSDGNIDIIRNLSASGRRKTTLKMFTYLNDPHRGNRRWHLRHHAMHI